MARIMKPADVITMAHTYFAAFLRQRRHAEEMDKWHNGVDLTERANDEYGPYVPKGHEISDEHIDLGSRTFTPWIMLATDAMTQTMYLDGIRRASGDSIAAWDYWRMNGMESKQIPLHNAILRHGLSSTVVLPGRVGFRREKAPVIKPYSARDLALFYEDYEDDEFPLLAIGGQPYVDENGVEGWTVILIDEQAVHRLSCTGDGIERDQWKYITYDEHELGFTPAVLYPNREDLGSRPIGEVEPFVPLSRRIQQDVFDRLIVQRFGAWKVRYIAGLAKPAADSPQATQAEKLRLSIENILISTSPDTKFGTLDASDIKQFIEAHGADLRDFSAVTQTPPHHVLGLSSNLQAEALAAAEAGLRRKSIQRKVTTGERHERTIRIAAYIGGDSATAESYDLQSRWRDTEQGTLSQVADALGKLGSDVGVPQEMLFEMMPGWDDYDVQRALSKVQSGAIDRLLAELEANAGRVLA